MMKSLPRVGLALLALAAVAVACSDAADPAAPVAPAYAAGGNAVDLTSGLISWWPGDGHAQDVVDGNHGTMENGAGFAPGMVLDAFSFDGVDDYMQVGASPNLVLTTEFTIDFWIFPTGPGGSPINGGVIVNKEGEYEIHRFADGTIRPAIANAVPGWTSINTGFVAPAGDWTHIALVYDNVEIRTYGNGVLVHAISGSGALGDAHTQWNDFRIGGRPAAVDEFFQGLVDEVDVFNRALSSAEIADIYKAGSTGKRRDVVLCHKPASAAQTLTVPSTAVPAHLAHGDTLGACL